MKWSQVTSNKSQALILMLALALSGCVVRSYPLTKDRIDQDLTAGNRGYLQGRPPSIEAKDRPTTRTTQVVEIELKPFIRFEKGPKAKAAEARPVIEESQELQAMGNRGYITQSDIPETAETPDIVKYKVAKGDTLQKISQKFYGTTKKWNKIYEANRDVLSGPNKIYPGQVINVPSEDSSKLKEIPGHLK